VALEDLAAARELLGEVFGPSTLLVRYGEPDELPAVAAALEGQLTATVHGEPFELEPGGVADALFQVLVDRAGRLILNQFPTGVAYQNVPEALLPAALREG